MNTAVLDTRLSDRAYRMYCVLDHLAGDGNTVEVTGPELGRLLGKGQMAVWQALDELRNKGYVERIIRHGEAGRIGALPNLYILQSPGGLS